MNLLRKLFGTDKNKSSSQGNHQSVPIMPIATTVDCWQLKVKTFVQKGDVTSRGADEMTSTTLLLEAQDLSKSGQLSQAQSVWNKAITELENELTKDPIDSFSLYNLGIAYEAVNEPYKAIDAHLASLLCEPNAPAVHSSLAYLYEKLQMLPEAINNFAAAVRLEEQRNPRKIVKADNNPIRTHIQYNFCLERAGYWNAAVDSWQRLVQKDPNHPFHRVSLAFALMMEDAAHNTDSALNEVSIAIQMDRDGSFGIKNAAEEFIQQVHSFKRGGKFTWRNNDGQIVVIQHKT